MLHLTFSGLSSAISLMTSAGDTSRSEPVAGSMMPAVAPPTTFSVSSDPSYASGISEMESSVRSFSEDLKNFCCLV